MCGIVGYVGSRRAADIIVGGLRRLEYRGYDSAGLAVVNGGGLEICRSAGKIRNLEERLARTPVAGTVGVGHTRWATHGRPSEDNAHPHADCAGTLAVVHNGILENYIALKERLIAEGHRFRSETDTEVLAHLIEARLRPGVALVEAVRQALADVRGAYAVGVVSTSAPGELVTARHGAGGVIIGLGETETLIASDIPALLEHTRNILVLEDDEVAVVTRGGARISRLDGTAVARQPARIAWDAAMAEKGGYPHFMLKEIHEQARAVTDTFREAIAGDSGEVSLPHLAQFDHRLREITRVVFVACGTSYHAALVGRTMVERLAGLPAEVDLASEFRYRDLALRPDTLVLAISQSGETADTLGAAKAARARRAPVVAITNVVGSALAREASGVVYTHAGPEIGVASTKTFTATLTAAYLLALRIGQERGYLTQAEGRKRIEDLVEVPALMDETLAQAGPLVALAAELATHANFLYLGRGGQYPVALEGALKLKELSYLHAEGYAAGEMKHGPIALIDRAMPVVVLAPRDATYDRMIANIEEVRAREGRVIAVGHRGDGDLARRADRVVPIPATAELLAPLVSVIPLQLLAYHIAVLRGCDVDQPRNLAKSVTVE
jgi:glucosamine--fructose-6-phosphate aminotransferase (isomerizing)